MFQPDPNHDVVIIVPTVASPTVLVPMMARLTGLVSRENVRVGIVLSVNSPEPDAAEQAVDACRKLCEQAGVDLLVHLEGGPIGFAAANNRGTIKMLENWGVPEITIYHNDDAHPTVGWLTKLLATLRTDVVHGYSEPWDPEGDRQRPPRPREAYGPIGIIGPLSNLVAGIQLCLNVWDPATRRPVAWSGDPDSFAQIIERRYGGQHVTADFVSGFCIGISAPLMRQLMLMVNIDHDLVPWVGEVGTNEHPYCHQGTTEFVMQVVGGVVGPWDEHNFPIAGYEDNDLCIRAELAGYRCLISAGCFVAHIGHQTFDRLFPEQLRGMRNRIRYYQKWQPYIELHSSKLVAAMRIRFEVGHDMHMLRSVLQRLSTLVDGVSIVLTANPLDVKDDARWPQEQRLLAPPDMALLDACNAAGQPDADGKPPRLDAVVPQIRAAMEAWIAHCLMGEGSRITSLDQIRVEVWTGVFNERDERNYSHQLAEELDADWIISVDGDEIVENRITRAHFERWMRHPDPMVRSWDWGFQNHWDSPELVREDPPWGDGGKYIGGMHGFRMWRVPRSWSLRHIFNPRRIFAGTHNGLHCGNSPDHDSLAKRVSGGRFRHFGYVRHQDRIRKHIRYQDQDQNPDPMLTGNAGRDAYGHILTGEGMRTSHYSPVNGIGLHLLLHRGETPEAFANLLDQLYGLVDRIVVVWTGPWSEEDKGWLAPVNDAEAAQAAAVPEHVLPRPRVTQRRAGLPSATVATGPTRELASVGNMFGVDWLHQPLNDDLAAARNAGLGALCMRAIGMGWSMFWDLDEHFPDMFGVPVALRRMAEATDPHGWLVTFVNQHEGTEPSISESVRIARLIPGMYFTGRVHETFDDALEQIGRKSGAKVRIAPFQVRHTGLAKTDEDMDRKLQRYQRLLLLELEDRPHSAAHWVALALHALNDGDEAVGRECLERAVLCDSTGYLAFRELAYYHLRKAMPLLLEAMRRTSSGHSWFQLVKPLHEALAKGVPSLPKIGSARHGLRTCPPFELPEFQLPARPGGFGYNALGMAEPMDGTMAEPTFQVIVADPTEGDTKSE